MVGFVKIGAELLVNTETLGLQSFPTVTGLVNGGFVVSWRDGKLPSGRDQDGPVDPGPIRIKAQVFGSDGAKVGAELLIDSPTRYGAAPASVTGLTNGGFVV